MKQDGHAYDGAIISIHPCYVEAILAGTKTIELRRRVPAISVGTDLWIYATRPVKAVVGVARVAEVVRGDPEEIWKQCGKGAVIRRIDFDVYFSGAEHAVGIVLAEVRRNIACITIEQLRKMRRGFHPPQVLMSITNREANSLRRWARVETRNET